MWGGCQLCARNTKHGTVRARGGRGSSSPRLSPSRLWLHSQLIDEDVGHPDALYGEGDLRQVVEASWVPLEELICPVLRTRERGLGR